MSSVASQARVHRAARLEDALHGLRLRAGRRLGMKPMIVPFVGYGSPDWVRVLCRVHLTGRRGDRKRQSGNARGWRSFVAITIGDEPVTITAGTKTIVINADRGGVIDTRVDVKLSPGWQKISLSVSGADPVTASVFIVDPRVNFGIVSDVDDTVMVTAIPRPFLAGWNTFVLNEHARSPVTGMAVLYERLANAHPGSPIVYISTGAWNVAPTLSRFLSRNLYPPGPLLLTDWGPTHDRWFRSGRQHKRQSLEQLAVEFPGIRWLLIGDDGQRDEEIYGEFAAKHPRNVAGIAIRRLSPGEAVLAGGRSKAGSTKRSRGALKPIDWMYAPNGSGLADLLVENGILPPRSNAVV